MLSGDFAPAKQPCFPFRGGQGCQAQRRHREEGAGCQRRQEGRRQGGAKEAAEKEPAKEAPAKPADEAKPATEKVKKGPFRIDVKLEGVFEAQNMIELCIRPEEWSGLSVLKAVEHGAMVKRGDLVLALDLEKIDLAIADQDRDLQLAALSLKDAEETLRALEKSAPLDMEAADRANRVAQEDLKQFSDVEYPLSLKTAAMVLEVAKDTVEYEEEELRQLEKMYKADEATKETEQIVLKRARDTVKRAKFILERTKAEADEFLKLVLPRHGDKIKEAAKRADIDLSRAKITLPIALTKQRLEFEKLKVQHEQAEKHLRKLREDRTLMTVKAPADGIIYYGKCSHGKWSGAGSETLHRGNSISPGEVFMTLVQTRPLLVHVSVPESDIQYVRAGLQAVVEPSGLSDLRLPAIVQHVGAIPMSSGSFDGQLTVALDGQADAVMPGMNCEVKMVPSKKQDALTVSPKAVFRDDLDVQHHYVYVAAKSDKGKAEKRAVTIGKRNDKQVEILSGLKEGEEVLLERPKDEQ